MATWRALIVDAMLEHKESWADVVSCTLDDEDLDREFYDGFGSEQGAPFTVWTQARVYFPVGYDGSEWASSVSRNPDGVATDHQGGG